MGKKGGKRQPVVAPASAAAVTASPSPPEPTPEAPAPPHPTPLGETASTELPLRAHVRGLANLGNTCYFNSTLQCLAALSAVHRHITCREPKPGEGALLCALRDTLRTLLLPGKCVTPSGLLAAVVQRAPRFKGSRQQDAQELLRVLVDGIDDDEVARMKKRLAEARAAAETSVGEGTVPRPPRTTVPASAVQRAFGAKLVSVISCGACGFATAQTEPCLDVSLQVRGRATNSGGCALPPPPSPPPPLASPSCRCRLPTWSPPGRA